MIIIDICGTIHRLRKYIVFLGNATIFLRLMHYTPVTQYSIPDVTAQPSVAFNSTYCVDPCSDFFSK